MKKSVKLAIGISAGILGAAAIAGIVYELISIKKLLSDADTDEMDLDDLFEDEIEAEEAFAELTEAD